MIRKGIMVLMLVWGGFVFGQDLQTVLDHVNDALGVDARNNILHMQSSGHAIMAGTETKIPFKLMQSKPDMVRVESTMFGLKMIQTYDGKSAWQLSPTSGMEATVSDPRRMEFMAAATAIDGPFSVNKNNKYTLSYGGKDEYLGKESHVLIWQADEERLKYYINKDTWLVDGLRYEYKKNGGWYSLEYRVSKYQKYGESAFPSEIAAVVNGVEMILLYITDIEALAGVDRVKYEKPTYNN